MKKVKFAVAIIVGLVLVFFYAHIAKANLIYDKSVDSSEYLSTGVVDGEVEQELVCVENSLDGITVKTQLVGDTQNAAVGLTVIEKDSGNIVAEGELKATDIKSGKFNRISFPTIEECKNKTYVIRLENRGDNVPEGSGISFSYQNTTEENTKLVINGNETQGTLIVKTITDRFDLERFVVLILMIAYMIGFFVFLSRLFGK